MMQSMAPNLMVSDVNKSVEYYCNLFGFKLEMSVPDSGQLDWAMVKEGGVELMFQSAPSLKKDLPSFAATKPGGTFTLFAQVDDVQELYNKVKGKVTLAFDLHRTFYGMDEFTIQDLDGYYVTFATPAKQP